jgi:hypothetical protein
VLLAVSSVSASLTPVAFSTAARASAASIADSVEDDEEPQPAAARAAVARSVAAMGRRIRGAFRGGDDRRRKLDAGCKAVNVEAV